MRTEYVDSFLRDKIAIRVNEDNSLFDFLQKEIENRIHLQGTIAHNAKNIADYAYKIYKTAGCVIWSHTTKCFEWCFLYFYTNTGYEVISIEDFFDDEDFENPEITKWVELIS